MKHAEPVLVFDREPINTRLTFKIKSEEDKQMTKPEFVAYIIQHHEDFPAVGEIDLAAAETVLENLDSKAGLPDMTPEEFMETWNTMVHDPAVMDIE